MNAPVPCQRCHEPIIFGKSPKGANMPYDARPLVQNDPRVTARVVIYKLDASGQGTSAGTGATLGMMAIDRGGPFYVSHFVSCTHPQEFSKRGVRH